MLYSDELGNERVDVLAHVSQVPSFVHSRGLFLDVTSCSVVLSQGFVWRFNERCKLDGPDGLLDCLESCLVALAAPESINDVLDANDAVLTQQFLNHHIVWDCKSFGILALEVATLADDLVEDDLVGCAPAAVVLHQEELLEGLSACSDESAVVDFLQTQLFQDFLCLRSGISWLLDSDH